MFMSFPPRYLSSLPSERGEHAGSRRIDVGRLTLLGEYDTYRAGSLLNRRPDGSFTNW
jgi:hypothetical protein